MKRLTIACLAAAAAVVLAGCGSGDDEASPTTTTTVETNGTTATSTTTTAPETEPEAPGPAVFRIVVRDGVPVGGIARPSVSQDDRVVLLVGSDVSDHVHVHGYDLFADVAPGERARIAFRATIPGRFEVELEDRGVPIAELTVRP